ncbi:MAG: NAD(P)/FAD-dependent oxidoreductase [Gammaproteobacteria bacterium]|nr:NAD(P)/FAD-dependent oxidoreductase [Gammaproteobacteria bacterium]
MADYDVVIVGASFAGLSCARAIARAGLEVLVLERKFRPDDLIHTTGILVKEAHEEWRAPEELVREIHRVRVYGPSLRSAAVERDDYFFLATDTGNLLGFLQEEARDCGVDVRLGIPFHDAARRNGQWHIDGADICCRYLVGADGARSQVAKSLDLDRNTRYLKGVEYAFEPCTREELSLHCFVDPRFARGYMGWVLPGVGVTQVGMAYHPSRAVDLLEFVKHIDPIFDLSDRKVLEKRGGIIPIGGLLQKFFTEGAMLVGDAAGMVSPLTAGGIHRAYRFGRLAGIHIAQHLLANGPDPGQSLRNLYPKRHWQHAARWAFDRLPVGSITDVALRTPRMFRRVVGKIFFDRMNWPE